MVRLPPGPVPDIIGIGLAPSVVSDGQAQRHDPG
jgi:hypothetical protein